MIEKILKQLGQQARALSRALARGGLELRGKLAELFIAELDGFFVLTMLPPMQI